MYTKFDKAVVAFVLASIGLANYFGFNFGIDQSTVAAIVAAATPVLVWLVPNLPKD